MADTAISALPSATTLAGTEAFPVVQSGTKKSTIAAIYTYFLSLFEAPSNGSFYGRLNAAWARAFIVRPYDSGSWYYPDIGVTYAAGAATILGGMRLSPIIFYRDAIVTDLAAHVTTQIAASNFQLAIYAATGTNGAPDGAPLCVTPSISGAALGAIGGTLSAPVAIPAGTYWAAVLVDTAGIIFKSVPAGTASASAYYGNPSLLTLSNSATISSFIYFLNGQTYGAWPTISGTASISMTAATMTQAPAVFWKQQ